MVDDGSKDKTTQVRLYIGVFYMSPVVKETLFGISDQVQHKPRCTATEVGLRLEISDLGSRGIVLSVKLICAFVCTYAKKLAFS